MERLKAQPPTAHEPRDTTMVLRIESNVEPIPGYRLLERLGSGGFGEVWKCEAPGGIHKAVKIIHGDLRSKEQNLIQYAEQELKALKRVKSVRHPYLLALDRYDIVEGRLLIVMELADCNLWDRFRQCRLNGLHGIPREDLLAYMMEAAEVLDLMNFEHQLMHLDIKPQNIFLQYNHVKVGDFGQVKDLEGIMASVTGGITPVYAAPETFDGLVTRYCDQYSLACVYQELLSGQRPFDGASMQQLLMQHLSAPPNLEPSPPTDRPALEKALAKKPEDRFGNCLEFVRALRHGMPRTVATAMPPLEETRAYRAPVSSTPDHASAGTTCESSIVTFAATGTESTPLPAPLLDAEPARSLPPEKTGPGPIRPTLVIGAGGAGLRLLQRFRKLVNDRYGTRDALPAIRTLFIDTDPDTLAAATAARDGDGGLKPDEVFPARLNRSTHYLKPRQTGRTLIEGWFDPALLHRLSRNPTTMGIRAFGRLALCDHYRTFMQKIEAELELCTADTAIQDTLRASGLELASNRPRVYVAASLAGGTGGGMFIDLAYILRNRLRKLGYNEADVVGLLLLPTDSPDSDVPPQAQVNVVAALTELNHYCRPENAFQSFYDDRHSFLRDEDAPFTRICLASIVLPQPQNSVAVSPPPRSGAISSGDNYRNTPNSGSQKRTTLIRGTMNRSQSAVLRGLESDVHRLGDDPLQAAAEWLRLAVLSPFGRTADIARPKATGEGPPAAAAWGMIRYDWPRSEILARTARIISGVVLDQWVSPNQGRAREVIPAWTAAQWLRLRLDLDGLIEQLRHAVDQALKAPVERTLTQMAEQLVPRGWLQRAPDPTKIVQLLAAWDQMLGHPSAAANRQDSQIEKALRPAAVNHAAEALMDLNQAVPRLIDDPKFRLAGAEEAACQLLADVNRMAAAITTQADRLEKEALAHHQIASMYAHNSSRHPASAVKDAVLAYPRARYQALLARFAARTYAALVEAISTIKNDMANCRQRLLGFKDMLRQESKAPSPPIGPRQVMPLGCDTIHDAAKRYLDVLTDNDLHELETWVQGEIDQRYGGLYEACLNTADGATSLLGVLRNQTRAYLDARLGQVNLAAMFAQQYGSHEAVVEQFRQAAAEAVPDLIDSGPWSRDAVRIFAAPAAELGEALRQAASEAVGPKDFLCVDTPDEALFYCEYPQVPLAALPHFNPSWQAAYDAAYEILLCTPHARTDVQHWISIDSD